MCLTHNSLIRGFNSIYQQAPHVKEVDLVDFIGYSLTWYRFIKSHHDGEETGLFPIVEQVLNDKNIWNEAHDEHEALLGGLAEFNTYLSTLPRPSAFSSTTLLQIMDSFQHEFEHHFHHEIPTIVSFASHPNAPRENTAEATVAESKLQAWGKKSVVKAGVTDVAPFFLYNLDRTFEGGQWASWPPIPPLVKFVLINVAGAWHGRWWKFASCDVQGSPQELYALRE
ncbi:hypothetical protein ACHAPJ_010250 [Fusarium lateritium]